MVVTVKVAGCPGTTNTSESGWFEIMAGSTASERVGGRLVIYYKLTGYIYVSRAALWQLRIITIIMDRGKVNNYVLAIIFLSHNKLMIDMCWPVLWLP